MNICYASIVAMAIFAMVYFIIRKPSKEGIKKFNYFKIMNVCYATLLGIAFLATIVFIFRKPSKKELEKFESKDQDKINWSKMGF